MKTFPEILANLCSFIFTIMSNESNNSKMLSLWQKKIHIK